MNERASEIQSDSDDEVLKRNKEEVELGVLAAVLHVPTVIGVLPEFRISTFSATATPPPGILLRLQTQLALEYSIIWQTSPKMASAQATASPTHKQTQPPTPTPMNPYQTTAFFPP